MFESVIVATLTSKHLQNNVTLKFMEAKFYIASIVITTFENVGHLFLLYQSTFFLHRFSFSMMYYGVVLDVRDISDDRYSNIAIMAAIDYIFMLSVIYCANR